MIRMILGTIKNSVAEAGKILRATFDGRIDEQIEGKPVFGMFGFQSRPRNGARCVTLRDGETFIILGGEDARYRFSLEEGDAVIYADADNWVKIKGDGSGIVVQGKRIDLAGSGGESLKKLVTKDVLSVIAGHTHPVAGTAASASLDPKMVSLASDVGNTTQIVEAC